MGETSYKTASVMVDTCIARLSLHAPLLTAHCAFEQISELKYCVAADQRHESGFSILTREDFSEALFKRRFALLRPPFSDDERKTDVGARAGVASLMRTFDGLTHFIRGCRSLEIERRGPEPQIAVLGMPSEIAHDASRSSQ